MVLHWNTVALDTIRNDYILGHVHDQGGPTQDSRVMAIVSAAIYDSVNAVAGGYTPYLVNIHAAPGTSMDAAIAQAGHDTLHALYPHQTNQIDAALTASLTQIAAHTAPADLRLGTKLGHYVAERILVARKSDGAALMPVYTPGMQPGQWKPDPSHPNQVAFGDVWGHVKPFMMTSDTQFRMPSMPSLTSKAYAASLNEVKRLGGDGTDTPTQRTPAQTIIGIFWAYDNQPGIGSPIVHYDEITQTIARQEHNTEVQNARLFALVNMSMADSAIAAWNMKYTYNFWRPVTGIREAATDGNPLTTGDPTWTPMGSPADNGTGTNFTPPFPAYISGHATIGGALFTTLRHFYGTDKVSFTIGSDELNGVTRGQNGEVRPVVTRHFTSFTQAERENAWSRIFLGVHWTFDSFEGMKEGTVIANYTFTHDLQPTAKH
jgi:membrane-associated phospholipid phosphatase